MNARVLRFVMYNMEFTVEYLDLTIPKVDRQVTKLEQFTHKCYFTNQFKHNIRSDNPQLNTIIDMLISLSTHLEKQDKDNPLIDMKRNLSQKLVHNMEYVKNQNNDIIKAIGQRKNTSLGPNILIDLDKKYKEIKLVTYKHQMKLKNF